MEKKSGAPGTLEILLMLILSCCGILSSQCSNFLWKHLKCDIVFGQFLCVIQESTVEDTLMILYVLFHVFAIWINNFKKIHANASIINIVEIQEDVL